MEKTTRKTPTKTAKKPTVKKKHTKAELDKIRDLMADLYINKGYQLDQLSKDWDVSMVSISKWKKGRLGEKPWDERKSISMLTPIVLREKLMEQALKIAEGGKSEIDADALSKIMKAIESQENTINPRVCVSVLKAFDNWFVKIDPAQSNVMTKWHKEFLIYLIKETNE